MRRLRDLFDASLVRELAAELARADPAFDAAGFVALGIDGLDRLELTQRARQLADAMHQCLPRPFARAAETIVASLGPEILPTGENGLAPLRYMPHVYFVEKYGLEDFETAMRAQYELTKRFSAEFSIRSFLVRHPEATYARLLEWTQDDNAHVRRLVSEGTRPRLPWAPRLTAFQKDPRPVVKLLELLKDDPARYVQRSVANNLNDISKDHPETAAEVCRRWSADAPSGRAWIVRHALRSLVKSGHKGALTILGTGAAPEVALGDVTIAPATVQLGGTLRFSFGITSTARTDQALTIDYAVHFVKANGDTRPKVFKLRRITLRPSATAVLGGTISFQDMTTRRHYPGRHRIELLINGVAHPIAEFDVSPAETGPPH